MRNDMYLVADAIRLFPEAGAKFSADDTAVLKEYRASLEAGTRFIPNWVKVSVAIALGLGTMVGWRRIVVICAERNPPIFRSSSQPSSILVLTSAPPRRLD